MGYYGEYIDRKFGGDELAQERKVQLRRIAAARGGRDILVYAADMTKSAPAPTSIIYEDLLPIRDQLSNLNGRKIDLILETPGGSGEVAEQRSRNRPSRNTFTFRVVKTAKTGPRPRLSVSAFR